MRLKFCRFYQGKELNRFSPCPSENFDSSKLKEFADDNFRSDGNGINFYYRPENTVGKGEIPRYERFHLFRSVF